MAEQQRQREPASPGVVGEVTVEVGDERNRPFLWAPTKKLLRGRWQRSNLRADELTEALAQMPDIPGLFIQVDVRRKLLRIFDPLALPENEQVLQDAKRHIKTWYSQETTVEPEYREEAVSDNRIKTWLYWLRRMVDGIPVDASKRPATGGPMARIVSGTLPVLTEVLKMPGKIRIEGFNSSPKGHKYLEDVPAMDTEY